MATSSQQSCTTRAFRNPCLQCKGGKQEKKKRTKQKDRRCRCLFFKKKMLTGVGAYKVLVEEGEVVDTGTCTCRCAAFFPPRGCTEWGERLAEGRTRERRRCSQPVVTWNLVEQLVNQLMLESNIEMVLLLEEYIYVMCLSFVYDAPSWITALVIPSLFFSHSPSLKC